MKYALCAIASVMALTACNKSPSVNAKNASGAEVAQQVRESGAASDLLMQAGQWHVTSVLDEMNMPGMPAAAQSHMKQIMGETWNTKVDYCLSPEEAKKPRGGFFTGKEGKECRYDHFTMGGGKIDAVMHCQSEGPTSMTMTVNGTYSPDSYASQVTMNMGGGPRGSMTLKMHSEAHRVGECSAKQG